MKFGSPPFAAATSRDTNYKLFKKNPATFFRCHPGVRKSQVTPDRKELISLLTRMFAADVTDRPQSVQEMLSHPYFSDADLSDTKLAQDGLREIIEDQNE